MAVSKAERKKIQQIGDNIVRFRKLKGLRQIDLAHLLEIEDSSLRRIETGKTNPTTTTLLRLIEALDISISELFEKEKLKKT